MTPKTMLAAGVPRKDVRRALRRESARFGPELTEIPVPDRVRQRPGAPARALRSRTHLVQVFEEAGGVLRLSVNLADIGRDGDWLDGITWDDLQRLKAEAGYGDREAVEVYPPDADLVDVAAIRHLWVLPEGERMPFSWGGADR